MPTEKTKGTEFLLKTIFSVSSVSSVVPLSPIQELEPGAMPFLMVGVGSWLSSRTATTAVNKNT